MENVERIAPPSEHWVQKLIAPPDEVLLAAGAEGERRVATVRLVIISLLLLTPTYKLIQFPDVDVFVWGFFVTLAGAISAAFVFFWLRANEYRSWMGFYSSIADVTLISLALGLFMYLDSPLVALNSKVTFEIYFLAITASSLRYDQRIALSAGLIAVAQYGGMVWLANQTWDLTAPGLGQATLGSYSAVDQITRIILLLSAVIIAQFLVMRAQRLLYLSTHDPLTGVSNRAFFDAQYERDFGRAQRDERKLTVVMVDADDFKAINDNHGHRFGDKVLIFLANSLGKGMRRQDVVARYGGEEFVLLFPGASKQTVVTRMFMLRKLVAAECAVLDKSVPGLQLTFSAGVASFPEDGKSPEKLIEVADRRLLEAKAGGKDQVRFGTLPDPEDEETGVMEEEPPTTPNAKSDDDDDDGAGGATGGSHPSADFEI